MGFRGHEWRNQVPILGPGLVPFGIIVEVYYGCQAIVQRYYIARWLQYPSQDIWDISWNQISEPPEQPLCYIDDIKMYIHNERYLCIICRYLLVYIIVYVFGLVLGCIQLVYILDIQLVLLGLFLLFGRCMVFLLGFVRYRG